ncbi:MAG: hypothetical protein LGL72_14985 [Acidibrevibacterium sp.]|jgi:hypothetical protein|uniref:hypothetical protein n=1 Tax=Acidibrevibacterium fodinaquatile TaxID=1969806 RepID=UPI0023A7FA53|nr:hypothetical protein [Acidibrevibacterium fodinaquatile]MCA7120660.1 hypothetical protein [Acidibrevibacterium fodinaquatile]
MSSARRKFDISCRVDIEQSPESLHAHAIPEGVSLRPGDTVIVHGVPSTVAFGEHLEMTCRATVFRAGIFERLWLRFSSLFELTELYEVGFQPKELA